ncbi:NAD(+) synthase [Trichloromonas sp.]|uniref:NAD(+) synthase n=1 Tax=Trichloromonas sp. TaxID=3069249 RepID=UPI002A4BCBB1|nr:NAD(+) synthase [Trichloromonas sp.]
MMKSLSEWGYCRLGVAVPELRVADIAFNLEQMRRIVDQAEAADCGLLLFPELALTAYSCGDLFFQPLLIEQARRAVAELAADTRGRALTLVVGAPIRLGDRLYNCAVVLGQGRILGIVPKIHLPNSHEFYEQRWFASGRGIRCAHMDWDGEAIPFGTDLLFCAANRPECLVGIELCEDLWVAHPPSGLMAQQGATVLLNPSASPETLGKDIYRRELVCGQSARCLAAYAYASAGPGESSTDLVFSGHSLIAENGVLLAETERFRFDSQLVLADVDLTRLRTERGRNSSFALVASGPRYREIPFLLAELPATEPLRPRNATPFVPADDGERTARCREIFALQTTALAKRLRHTGVSRVVLGISGGLDSTLALLVAVKAFDLLGLDRTGVLTLTLPGFGTTARTRGNAERLAELLGVGLRVIPIDAAVRSHFADIGHPETLHDITYENAQARERTQILMDVANQVGGLVVGTGDLSELALGWCTYNADHMSMYGVNAGVPKTLVRYLVAWCAESEFTGEAAEILKDICATPVSPELLPPTAEGEIAQKTEDHVGPYVLHDFFLYHMVRWHDPPGKIYFLACRAFADEFLPATILRWLRIFYRRFFSQQFKRSCLPDGPKIGSVALSPRGDWRMPSDACVDLWLRELDGLDGES